MPIPIPVPGPLPPPPPVGTPTPGLPGDGRNLPFWLGGPQKWAIDQVANSHLESLYLLGELSMFVLMWRAADLMAGLVGLCPVCSAGDDRPFAAYEQPTRHRCPSCFGTTFEGGYRARIIRPSLWIDRTQDSADSRRGQVVASTLALETTRDFTLHTGDYIFRIGGSRYRCAELDSPPVRTGFETPSALTFVGGAVDRVSLEDPSSVAYSIPPSRADVDIALITGGHLVAGGQSPWEVIRGPLVVSSWPV
jgi:hypothetical protein